MLNLRQIFYITNDVERAVLSAPMEGIEYHIVTFENPYSEYLTFERSSAKSRNTLMNFSTSSKNIFFLVSGPKTSTEELMKRKEVLDYIRSQSKRHPRITFGTGSEFNSARLPDGQGSRKKNQKQKDSFGFLFSGSQVKPGMTRVERPFILVFKPTVEIEEFCEVMGWRLLNPFSKISGEFEEKISQIKLLKSLGVSIPKHLVAELGELDVVQDKICYTPRPDVTSGHPSPSFAGASADRQEGNDNNPLPRRGGLNEARDEVGLPAILQYNLGHTGEGTLVIRREKDLELLKKKFPKREVRVSEYIQGIPITVNAIVGKKVYVSAPSVQITGIPLLTANKFATVGNDWSYFTRTYAEGNADLRGRIRNMCEKIGNALKKRGFRGAFGVDFMLDKNDNLCVIEVNSRQPASVIYESSLQSTVNRGQSTKYSTTMELHLKCLLGKDIGSEQLPETFEGAQIFVRAKKDMKWKKEIPPQFMNYESGIRNYSRERSRPFPTEDNAREYFIFSKLRNGEFVKKNSEVLRVQSNGGMVEVHMKLKEEVEEIVKKMMIGKKSKIPSTKSQTNPNDQNSPPEADLTPEAHPSFGVTPQEEKPKTKRSDVWNLNI